MAGRLCGLLQLGVAVGLVWAGCAVAPARATADLDALARDVDGRTQAEATVVYNEYVRHLNTVAGSIAACTTFLRQFGDNAKVAAILDKQREDPGERFFTDPRDFADLERVIGEPLDLGQVDLEICIRALDQKVGQLRRGPAVANFAALRTTLRKCLGELERVGASTAGIAVLQRVSRAPADTTYTSERTLVQLERAVGDLQLSARDLEACSDAYHLDVVLQKSLVGDNPPPCTSGETACETGFMATTCCSPGEKCIQATCRNCFNYCETPGCFPATATVQLEDGTTKAMPDVRLGDRVLVARADGSLGFEDIYLNTHKDEVSAAPYVELKLASGRSLSLSPRHFIPVGAGPDAAWGDHVAKGADELATGDHIWSRAADGTMQLDRVVAAQTKVAVGAFNPLTMSGTIVVDGVVASAHSDWFLDGIVSADAQTKVYQAVLAPVRVAYQVLGPQVMETVTESWGVVDAVRWATGPRSTGQLLTWSLATLSMLLALGGALVWLRRKPLR
jgi:hypothetical protein